MLGSISEYVSGVNKANKEKKMHLFTSVVIVRRNAPIDWDALNAEYEVNQKIRWAKLPKLVKEFYKEHPEVANMTQVSIGRAF